MSNKNETEPKSDYWRERAEEARTRADHMISEHGKRWMLEIANLYDKLARDAAKREAEDKF